MDENQFKNYKLYTEEPTFANRYRQEYSDSLYGYINTLKQNSISAKDTFMPPAEYAENPELYREKYIQMLGFPLTDYSYTVPEGKEEFVASDDLGTFTECLLKFFPTLSFTV